MNIYPFEHFYAIDTADTTRVLGTNPIDFNIYCAKMIYPSSAVEWRPNAVILVPLLTYHYPLLASPIIHFPINAPILYTHQNFLFPQTINEILRLSPTGKNVPAKVIIIGPVHPNVEVQLRNIGLTSFRIFGFDPITVAGEALEFRYRIPPDSMEGRENIAIVSAQDYRSGVPAAYFSAHMGVPILFAYEDILPDVTRQKLIKYRDKNTFIFGSNEIISDNILNEIKGIVRGKVDRIGGHTPYEVAANFSKYYSPEGHYGWDITKKNGWAFCFGVPENWADNLSACIFAHLAKHTPLLYVNPFRVPEVTKQYVLSLKPVEKHPPQPPYMHGYILGGFDKIAHKTQVELEEILAGG